MTATAWLQLLALVVLLALAVPLVGSYMARVFGGGPAPGDRVFLPVERLVYRVCGVDPEREQRWNVYALSALSFSLVSVLGLFVLLRVQGHLPLDPTHAKAMPAPLAFNTAVSFVTNTNWQNYVPESSMSHFTQMAGLTVQNFASAAVGLAVAIALVRGMARRRSGTLGNFWVDITRGTLRVLLPIAFLFALVLASQGVIQNTRGFVAAHTLEGVTQRIPGGQVASQEAIKELGTNGGGFFNANSAHPFENANGLTDLLEIFLLLVIPFSLTWTFGKMVGDRRQGYVLLAAMLALWLAASVAAMVFETNGNPQLRHAGVTEAAASVQAGGNAEGKETRFGPASCGLFAAATTSTSTGAVNCSHDSLTPLGGGVALVDMMLGEVSPGGVGSGLYGMLIFAMLAVFIAGLMVGRTPEYLGKKIQGAEMKLVVLYLLAVPLAVLAFGAASVLIVSAKASIANPGSHGLSEVVYGFTSAGNNNGSAFAGLNGNTNWYNTTLALSMLVGRFVLMVAALGIAGSLARKQAVPRSAGTFPTATPLFGALLVGTIVIVVGLTYLPVLALGPIVEQLRV